MNAAMSAYNLVCEVQKIGNEGIVTMYSHEEEICIRIPFT